MLLFSFMAYRSHLEIRVGLVTNPDTPPFSNRHHPVSCIAHAKLSRSLERLKNASRDLKQRIEEEKRRHDMPIDSALGNPER